MAELGSETFFATISELNARIRSKEIKVVDLVRAFGRRLETLGPRYNALALSLGEVPASRALTRLRERRAELGLPAGDDAPLVVDPVTGSPVGPAALPLHLRRAQVTRVSIEANAGICRGMLRHRYDTPGQGERLLSREEDQ